MKKNDSVKTNQGKTMSTHGKAFFTGGEMGAEVNAKDWSKTPLGPIEKWPQSLRTTISLCLASNFPISIAWGPKRVQIYNDGYWQICGDKHPTSMGQDFKECWFTAWPVIGEAFESAAAGQTKFLVNQRMFLDRNGYLEETFFTFSFSPIVGESGGVEGLFHPVTELTQQSLGDRRMNVLRNITMRTMNAKTTSEAVTLIMDVIKESNLDIPFGLLYTLNEEGRNLRLEGNSGLVEASALYPNEVELGNSQVVSWPFEDVIARGAPMIVENLNKMFGEFSCDPYEEPPHTAFLFPIVLPGLKHPFGIFVAGISSRREFDEPYHTFFDLVSTAITSAVAKAKAFEDELKKAEALLEIDKAKTAFFSNISHEFRTPLTLILGPVEDGLNDSNNQLPEEQKERLQLIQRNALRLQRLVNSLLDFSRIEAGRLDAKFSSTDLSAFTRELASMFHSAMEKASIEYIINCKTLSQPVYVDHEMWEKIVLNLLSNALKFTFQGKIQISLEEEDNFAVLKVKDTGEGISETELPNLFKRFYRVKGAKSRTHEGSGIGLAFIHELIKMHGGTIETGSELKKGTTFTVRIPCGVDHLPKEKIVEGMHMKSTSQSDVFMNESSQWLLKEVLPEVEGTVSEERIKNQEALILVVDDNSDMREYVSNILRKNEDWEIQTANNGLQALAFIKDRKPNLILSDIMMPEMDGFELLKIIREDITLNQIPFILLSARAGEEATLEGLEKKANDYLVKPFSARELFARIKTQLELDLIRKSNVDLMGDLENKNRQLENVNKELESFSYSVSHDLRAPLRSIIGYSKILHEDYVGKLDMNGKRVLDTISQNAFRMNNLIEDLLKFSKLGKKEIRKSEINVEILVKGILREMKSSLSHKANIRLENLPSIYGDSDLLTHVWTNLVSNAIKYSALKENPIVDIGSQNVENEIIFYVKDNGAGFDMKYADKLFGVFQRLHNSEEFEGTGVGLSIVSRIITKHGGRVWAEGKVNEGATFYFSLPIN